MNTLTVNETCFEKHSSTKMHCISEQAKNFIKLIDLPSRFFLYVNSKYHMWN